jgi:type IX secretion system PorP/SprF family membrane protein
MLPVSSQAQQNGHYSQYMYNKYQFNPAFGGMQRSLSVNSFYRSQWNQLTENPSQLGINAHMPLYLIKGSVGINLETENIGAERNTSVLLGYNYVMPTNIGTFSAGLSLGLLQKRLDGSILRTPTGEYETTVNHNDLLLSNNQASGISPNWRLGIYFLNNNFEAGISVNNLPSSRINVDPYNISLQTNFTFFGEMKIYLENMDAYVKPSILILANSESIQTAITTNLEYGNVFGGLGVRGYDNNSIEGIIFIMGMQIDKHYKLSYSYDYGLSSLQNVNDGSHEFTINYNLQKLIGIGLPPKIIYNTRNL